MKSNRRHCKHKLISETNNIKKSINLLVKVETVGRTFKQLTYITIQIQVHYQAFCKPSNLNTHAQ